MNTRTHTHTMLNALSHTHRLTMLSLTHTVTDESYHMLATAVSVIFIAQVFTRNILEILEIFTTMTRIAPESTRNVDY